MTSKMEPELLKILCCPESHQGLSLAPEEVVRQLNASIAKGSVQNRAGETVTSEIEGGLLREDGKFLYPIRNGIPVLLIEEALPVS